MKEILIGSSDFSEIKGGNIYYFVDKSMLIKEIIKGPKVMLVTRPRRWGKSLNLSMLDNFFADNGDGISRKELFIDLKIGQEKVDDTEETYVDKYQGKSPVITLSFKDIGKANNFEEVKKNLATAIGKCCEKLQKNKYVSNYLTNNKEEKLAGNFNELLNEKADGALLLDALRRLSSLLNVVRAK